MLSLSFASIAASVALAGGAPLTPFVQWDFNSPTPDAQVSSGSSLASQGAGMASAIGGTTAAFAAGSPGDAGGASDNSGWALGNFASASADNKTRGAQFMFSTVGVKDVMFFFNLRPSGESAAYGVVQYTVDGQNFIDHSSATVGSGNTWYSRMVDFSTIAAANNNPLFGVRVVAGFGPGGSYLASDLNSLYSTVGTWRFDSVLAAGTVAPVPEPETYALALAGLLVLGAVRRQR